jgi:dihydrofolate reductase
MAKLIYSAIASLDGYVSDRLGQIEWCAPSEEVLAHINELERPIGTYLYGRRMYETMRVWETMPTEADQSPGVRDFTDLWRAADKIVFSRTLDSVDTSRTRLERAFDLDLVRGLKASAERDLSVGGAEVAGQALRAGLVDELHLTLVPMIVGGGHPALPDGVLLALELLDQHRFANGTVHLHYRLP